MPSGFFIANALYLIPWLVLVVMTTRRQKQAENSQNEALGMLTAEQRHCMVPVNLARPTWLDGYFKICHFETKGILLIMPDQLRIIGRFPDGQQIDRIYPRTEAHPEWTSSKIGVKWLSIGTADHILLLAGDLVMRAVTCALAIIASLAQGIGQTQIGLFALGTGQAVGLQHVFFVGR